ncbi:hypothetical protein GCM10009715_05960 [Paeniglutamicibacter psychrophenolicus]
MIPSRNAWVFDTGPMRHFALQGWLGVLRFLADGREVYIPDSVERELMQAAAELPAVGTVLDADWIRVFRSVDEGFSRSFGEFHDRLVAGGKMLANAEYLPWARPMGVN